MKDRYQLAIEDYESHMELHQEPCGCFACTARTDTQDVATLQAQAESAIEGIDAALAGLEDWELRRQARIERGLG